MRRPLSSPRNEDGSIIAMTAFVIVALLLTIGLAVDASNLYRARLALQRAADAASIGALDYVTLHGKMKFEEEHNLISQPLSFKTISYADLLNPKAEKLVYANLTDAGFPPTNLRPVVVTGEYRLGNDPDSNPSSAYEYEVHVSRTIDFFLMGHIPFTSQTSSSVQVSSTARRRIANVALMFDASSSMNCPAGGTDCSCMKTNRTAGTACPSPSKMDKLLVGARKFLELFDLEYDRIAIVPFNIHADTISIQNLKQVLESNGVQATPMTTNVVTQLVSLISTTYTPSSVSNICDALISTQNYMRTDLAVPAQDEIAYVFFSDGAPTAGRFSFNDVKGGLQTSPIGSATYDYLSHTLAWVDPTNAVRYGPSLLAQTGMYPFGFADPGLPPANDSGKPVPDSVKADCNPATAPAVNQDSDVAGAVQTVFGSCLNSLRSAIPGGEGDPAKWYDADYVIAGGGTPNATMWKQTYYNCAMQLADNIRTDNGTFFTIGLGLTSAMADPNDPYADVLDTDSLKLAFLSRMTLDQTQWPAGTPEFSYQGYKTFAQAQSQTPKSKGELLPTPDDSELPLMFRKIAHRVLLKLIS